MHVVQVKHRVVGLEPGSSKDQSGTSSLHDLHSADHSVLVLSEQAFGGDRVLDSVSEIQPELLDLGEVRADSVHETAGISTAVEPWGVLGLSNNKSIGLRGNCD